MKHITTTVSLSKEQKEKANKIAKNYTGSTGLTSFVKFAIAHLWKDEFNE